MIAALAGRQWRGIPVWPPVATFQALRQRKLTRDVFFLQASNFLQKGYGFLFSVAAARLLGVAAYGDFLLALSLYNTINILGNMGMGQFLVVPLAQATAAGQREEVADACGFNLKVSAIVAAGVLAVAAVAGPWLGDAIMHRPDLGALAPVLALGSVPAVAYNVATSSLQASRRMKELAIVENVDIIVARLGAFAAVVAGWGMAGLMWGMVAGGALSAIHALYQYHRVAVRDHGFPALPALLAAAWRVPFRRFFRFSLFSVLDKNVGQFIGQTPMLFIGRWAGPEHAAYFGVTAKMFTLLSAFHGAVSKALSVRLAQEYGTHGAAATMRLFWRTTLLWGGIATVLAMACVPLLPVYRWVYGAEYLPSVPLVLLMAALAAKQGFTVSLGAIYMIADRVALNALAKAPLLLAALPLGAIMVQRWGAPGAAGYQLVTYLLGDALYFSMLATRWFWRGR